MTAKDRLIFPLDVADAEQARKYVKLLGDHVGLFKIGLELFVSEGPSVVESVAHSTAAGIFLDLKFHDIPITVQRTIRGAGCFQHAKFTTVHCEPGLLEAVVDEASHHTKILAVTVLTSLDTESLISLGIQSKLAEEPIQLVLQRAAVAKKAGCAGIVCSGREVRAVREKFGDDLIVVTPGIRPEWSVVDKDDQKRIVTPYEAIHSGVDYIVVGRPIQTSEEPVEAAARVVEEIERALQDRQQGT